MGKSLRDKVFEELEKMDIESFGVIYYSEFAEKIGEDKDIVYGFFQELRKKGIVMTATTGFIPRPEIKYELYKWRDEKRITRRIQRFLSSFSKSYVGGVISGVLISVISQILITLILRK